MDDAIEKNIMLLSQTLSALSGIPIKYAFRNLIECKKALLDLYSPFHPGDRVKLREDEDIRKSPGWTHCKHFLTRGSRAVVRDIDFRNGNFYADIVFDDDSWIGIDGKKHPANKKHKFCFLQSKLKKEKKEKK